MINLFVVLPLKRFFDAASEVASGCALGAFAIAAVVAILAGPKDSQIGYRPKSPTAAAPPNDDVPYSFTVTAEDEAGFLVTHEKFRAPVGILVETNGLTLGRISLQPTKMVKRRSS